MKKGKLYIDSTDTIVVALEDRDDKRFKGIVVSSRIWPEGTEYDGFRKQAFGNAKIDVIA